MKKIIPTVVIAAALLFSAIVMLRHGDANGMASLGTEFFRAQPVGGYGTQRALVGGERAMEPSLLRQGIRYHKQGDYDLALVSLRAYLEEIPVQRDYLPSLLAATAAFATGNYEEAREWLNAMPRETREAQAAFFWYETLLALRLDNGEAAGRSLRQFKSLGVPGYPADELERKWERLMTS